MSGGTSRGFVYVATRPSYVREAARSWATVRRQHPGAEAVLTTDCPDLARELLPEVTVRVMDHPRRHHGDKILPLVDSPFERTIFLNADVQLAAPLDDLFLMLERYDLLVAARPLGPPRSRHARDGAPVQHRLVGLPDSGSRSGVIPRLGD